MSQAARPAQAFPGTQRDASTRAAAESLAKVIERHRDERPQADVERRFVDEIQGRVVHGRLRGIVALRGGADEDEDARHLERKVGKILGARHEWHFDDIVAPTAFASTGSMRRVRSGSLAVTGLLPGRISSVAVAP